MALFKRGDLVWAKMKGFPPWPGIVTVPPPELRKQPSKKSTLFYCIFFFGSKNYSWIESHKLERYEKRDGSVAGKKSATLREACQAIEAYIENGEGADDFDITPEADAFDILISESATSPTAASSSASLPTSSFSKSKTKKIETKAELKGDIKDNITPTKNSIRNSSEEEVVLVVSDETNVLNDVDETSIQERTDEDPLKIDNVEVSNSAPTVTVIDTISKKKQTQPVVRAKPFRQQVPKEKRPIPTESDPRGSASSVQSNKKRNYESSYQENRESGKRKKLYTDADTTAQLYPSHSRGYGRSPAALLFERPSVIRPDTPPLDLLSVSQTLLSKHITPSPLRFGFLGLGIMGSGMVKNLLNSGHRVIVWNRTPEKSREFAKVGAEMAVTPQDVCSVADITFSCVSGPKAALEMVFGNCGVLREMNSTKAYVEMTNIDKDTSYDIFEAITSRGARYLEAQLQGSKAEASEGNLVILTAGDRSLYNECHSCFEAFGRSSFFLGDVGNASKMNLVIQMIAGISLAGLAEGLALADRCGLQQSDLLEVISLTSLRSPMITDKGKCITECTFPTSLALNHMQKDLKLGLLLGDELEQPLPLTATANEQFKHSKRLGYGDHDVSSVYISARF